jgi:hypothetical protein
VSDELLNAKKHTEVYYKYDIHWNYDGGYIGYKKLLNEMSKCDSTLKIIPLNKYIRKLRYTPTADLSKQLSLENFLLKKEWYYQPIDLIGYTETVGKVYPKTLASMATKRTYKEKSSSPKVVIYRDSYFNLICPFFSENFRECIYIWSNIMALEVLEKEKPDYVVYEITERYIDRLLEENPEWVKKAPIK